MSVRNQYRKNVGFHKLKKQKDVSSVNRDCFQFISLVCETSADEVDCCSANSTRTEVIYTGSFNSELLEGYWLSLKTWTPVQHFQLLIENGISISLLPKQRTAALWLTTESTSGEFTTGHHHERLLLNCLLQTAG